MKRLPAYDAHTSRAERYLFLGLSLAAAALITITASDALRFSGSQEEIATALSNPTTALAGVQTNAASTNLAVLHSGSTEERTRLDGATRPKS